MLLPIAVVGQPASLRMLAAARRIAPVQRLYRVEHGAVFNVGLAANHPNGRISKIGRVVFAPNPTVEHSRRR